MKYVMMLHHLTDVDTFVDKLFPQITLGTLLTLSGPLGVGKTTLVKAIAKRLGVKGHIISPTFTIMKVYPLTKGRLLHVDAYRLGKQSDIGLEEEMGDDTITMIEWPEQLANLPFSKKRIVITLSFIQDQARKVEVITEGIE